MSFTKESHKLGKRICSESETNQTVYAVESVAVSSLARRQLALLRVFHARANLTEHALLGVYQRTVISNQLPKC